MADLGRVYVGIIHLHTSLQRSVPGELQHFVGQGDSSLTRKREPTLLKDYATFSTAIAIPMPPLTHRVAIPSFALRFSISCTSVTVMRVPVQPMGCPSAIAPPLTFNF